MCKPQNRLKIILAEKKVTNKQLAERLGVSQSTVSKWCTNSAQPEAGNLLRIAKALGVELNTLLTIGEEP